MEGNLAKSTEKRLWVFGGLNVKGICKNKDCLAADKCVFKNWGYGDFSLSRLQVTSKCVLCEKNLKEVHMLYFIKCTWLIEA